MKRGKEWSKGNSRARFFNDYRVYCNASAWQTKVTFEKEMDIINNKMVREDRQLLIILDNVSTHKLNKTYSNMQLEFMMPNMTPQIQPLDHFFTYLKSVFKKWLNSQYVENKFPEKMEKINNIISFHKDVKPELIVKCWEKGGLKEETSSEIPDINIEEGEIEQSIMRSLEEGCSKLVLEDYATEETDQTEPDGQDEDDRIREDPDIIELEATEPEKTKTVLKQRSITQYFSK